MEFDKIHNVSRFQLYLLLIARFIMIIICFQFIFRPCRIIIKIKFGKQLSLIKVTHYLIRNPEKIIDISKELNKFTGNVERNINALAKYCSYDKRKRLNFGQLMDTLFP